MKCKLPLVSLYKCIIIFSALLFPESRLKAQTVIPVETNHMAMVLEADSNKDLNIIYFGRKLLNNSEYARVQGQYEQAEDYTHSLNSAYTPAGSRNLVEPAIAVTHSDGNNSLDLKYISQTVQKISDDVSLLTILMKDPVYDVEIRLFYKTYFNDDVVEQWSVIKHYEKGNITLQKFASANLYLKGEGFWLNQYHGDWAKEMRPEESRLTHGIKTLDTKLGTRANLFQPSVFMISLDKPATE